MRLTWFGLALALLAPVAALAMQAPPAPAHGALIDARRIASPPAGGKAYRIMYTSLGADGRTVPVSGIVVVPDGPAPAGGRPVVAWAHPTTGVQQGCAPSLSPFRFQMMSGLAALLKRGFVVTASDYPGLGTSGPHPFLDGPSEARAVLDSVLAASGVPGAQTSRKFALWGHSQGGQAVLFGGQLASTYAPNLQLVGVAAAAPATDLGVLLRDDLGTTGGNNLAALTLWAWNANYGAAYTGVVTRAALPAIDAVAADCIDVLIKSGAKRRAQKTLAASYFTVPDITAIEPWRSLIARNSAPLLAPAIPVFLAQGSTDVVVRPAVTASYATRLCANGSRVAFDLLPGVGHGFAAAKGANSAAAWIADRFGGLPPPSDCGRI